jgi:hypothetical protein
MTKVMLGATDDVAQSMADPTEVSRARISATRGDGGTSCSVGGRF